MAGDAVVLPGPVRTRALGLAADALPALADPPPSLRKVAGFAPQRRARLGGAQIAAALETDDDFRQRIADQVAAALPELAGALADGVVPAAADPVDVAAVAWLARPDGWEQVVADAVRRVEPAADPREAAVLERARSRVEVLERTLRDLRREHREQLDALKTENTSLRRRLGEERTARRTVDQRAESETVQALEVAQAAQTSAEEALAGAQSELQRLRAQVDELRTSAVSARRETRAERDEATLRVRLLTETLVDAAQGLRRELGLPAVTGTPAERVEAALAERAGTPGGRSAAPADAALLERHLAMPRSRLVVDGYNVSKTAWPDATLEAQRSRLLAGLAPLVSRTGAETTVVFDAASSMTRAPAAAPRGVKVLFSPQGEIADDVIRELVAAEPPGRVVVVVTSDAALAKDVASAGARPVAASALVTLLQR